MSAVQNAAVISPKLIGRETQLTLLIELLPAGERGSGLALISGEAGVGKSRLVAEVKAEALQRGTQILQGRCFEQDNALPYAPISDMLRAFCNGCPPHDLADIFSDSAPEFAELLPELTGLLPQVAPTIKLDPEQQKRRLFQSLVRFVQRVAAPAGVRGGAVPLLVIFEDIHWCDDNSLQWLMYLARQLGSQPLLLLLTYRNDELRPKLNEFLAVLDRLPFTTEVALTRLTRAEVDAMLRAIFALESSPREEFLDALYALTEGNPFFLEEVLKSMIAAGDIYQVSGEWTRKPLRQIRIPRTVQVAVQRRTRGLSDAAQRLLTLAAVAGQRFDFRVLQVATQHSEDELLQQVKELRAAQLVVEESDETFAFRHALTRQAIDAALLTRERMLLHRTVAEAMEQCYADASDGRASDLAYHFYEAGLWMQALAWSQRAGEQAERLCAYGEALRQYSNARDCADKLGQPDQVAVVDHAIGRVHEARGEHLQASEAYGRTLEATTDPAQRGVLKAELGATYVNLADARGITYLHDALNELDPATRPQQVAMATVWLARHYHLRAQYTQALTYLERAHELIAAFDDTATLGLFYGSMAIVLMYLARFEESMVWARRSVALGEANDDARAVVLGYLYLSECSEYLGHWQDTEEYAVQGRQFAVQSGWHGMEVWTELERLVVLYYRGELTAGSELARACLASASELDERRAALHINKLYVLIETELGDEETAYLVGKTTVREVDEVVGVGIRCWVRLALAGLHMQREEWGQAVSLYEQCASLLAGGENRVIQMELGPPMAEAYVAQGRLAEASRLISDMLALTQTTGARQYEAAAQRVQGQIFAAQGQHDKSLRSFDKAIAICTDLGSRLELAHALYHRGMLHRARRQFAAAEADWTRARSLCEQMGARALLWRLHAVLGELALIQQHKGESEREFAAARALVAELADAMHDESFRQNLWQRAAALFPVGKEHSARRRRGNRGQFGGLTAREREVAALIAQGKSNREIAAALVVSERTVTTHISNIFSRLGFTSRTQVAAWASEHGLVSPTHH